ncbi:MAG: hypothetical protein NTY87_00100 [Planctomycetia bacterium]|nr:hypothetical protein [Planctomycetia bacterium]
MPRGKKKLAQQITPKLPEVEVEVGRGKAVAEAGKKTGPTGEALPMGDIARFLHAAHHICAICVEATNILPLPTPWACRWPRANGLEGIETVAEFVDGGREVFLTQQAPTRTTLSKLGVFAATEAIAVGGADARVLVMEHLRMTRLVYEIARDSDRSPATPEFNDALNEWNASHEALVPYSHALASATSAATTPTTMPKKVKRSTKPNEVQIIAALTTHHKYIDGGCLNQEPIGNNVMASGLKINQGTTSAFFKKKFGGHAAYKRLCGDITKLLAAIRLLNNEITPAILSRGRGQEGVDPDTLHFDRKRSDQETHKEAQKRIDEQIDSDTL